MRRLNLWARLGLVLTALWIGCAGVYLAEVTYQCKRLPHNFGCGDYIVLPYLPEVFGLWHLGVWGDVLGLVILPPLAGWAAFAVAGWIIAGRQISN